MRRSRSKRRRRRKGRRRRRKWERRRIKWKRRRRHFTQTVKTKYMKTKQGCKKFVKQTWNPFD